MGPTHYRLSYSGPVLKTTNGKLPKDGAGHTVEANNQKDVSPSYLWFVPLLFALVYRDLNFVLKRILQKKPIQKFAEIKQSTLITNIVLLLVFVAVVSLIIDKQTKKKFWVYSFNTEGYIYHARDTPFWSGTLDMKIPKCYIILR